MPDSEHAIPSDGGYRDRTGDLLLAKARTPVHQGAPNGTPTCSHAESAAAAATRNRTTPESLSESLPALDQDGDDYEVACPECRGDGCEDCEYTGTVVVGGENVYEAYGTSCQAWHEKHWAALMHHARALDRSEACHTLRVRHHQAATAQRHVRASVSHVRQAVGA